MAHISHGHYDLPRGGMGRQINKASEDGKHWSWQLAIDQYRFQGFSRLLLNERTAGKWLIRRVLGLEFDVVVKYSNLSILFAARL